MLCNICLDDIEENKILTKCNHLFHIDCLNKIIYPNCPCCKMDITDQLKTIGLNLKKINNNIKAEKFRLFINSIDNYDDINKDDLNIISTKARLLNKNIWAENYKNIILSFINNISIKMLEFSNYMLNNNNDGLYLIYCNS